MSRYSIGVKKKIDCFRNFRVGMVSGKRLCVAVKKTDRFGILRFGGVKKRCALCERVEC